MGRGAELQEMEGGRRVLLSLKPVSHCQLYLKKYPLEWLTKYESFRNKTVLLFINRQIIFRFDLILDPPREEPLGLRPIYMEIISASGAFVIILIIIAAACLVRGKFHTSCKEGGM